MKKQNIKINADGECCIPGITSERIVADHVERYKFAAKYVKNKSVLDIACGSGYGSLLLAKSGARQVVGVDISLSVIRFARKKYSHQKVRYMVSDILKFQSEKKFDVIISFETIEHVKEDLKVLKKIYSLLSNGGIIILSTPNRVITSPKAKTLKDAPLNKYHIREYNLPEFLNLISLSGFKVNKKNVFGQRLRFFFKYPLLNIIYEILFNPNFRSNSKPRKYSFLSPRYILLIANK